MNSKKQLLFVLLIVWMGVTARAHAQSSEIENLFRDLEAGKTGGKPGSIDAAEPVLERLGKASRESVAGVLPVILHAASDPNVPVRRVAATALYQITTRPDGQALLSAETPIFTALLVDEDIPIRRISILAVAGLRPDANSPLVPVLETYLARQDAVATVGAAAATLLLQAAPNDAGSTNAVTHYMRRKDQTSASRYILVDAITHVARSRNRDIGREVAGYADDPDEQTSAHAIEALQSMGKTVVLDNQQSLLRIAADPDRAPNVRAAATKALSAFP